MAWDATTWEAAAPHVAVGPLVRRAHSRLSPDGRPGPEARRTAFAKVMTTWDVAQRFRARCELPSDQMDDLAQAAEALDCVSGPPCRWRSPRWRSTSCSPRPPWAEEATGRMWQAFEEARRRLDRAFPFRRVMQRGRTVGVTLVRSVDLTPHDVGRPSLEACAVWRSPRGPSLHRTSAPANHPDLFLGAGDASVAACGAAVSDVSDDHARSGLGSVLAFLAEASRVGARPDEVAHLVDCTMAHGGVAASDAREAVAAHVEARRAVLADFVATLDPRALAIVADPRSSLRADFGTALWVGLDRTFRPDAPLAHAILLQPDLCASLADAWVASPDDFRADDPVGTVASRILRGRDGARMARWLSDALRGLATIPTAEVVVIRRALVRSGEDFALHLVRKARMLPDWVPEGAGEWAAYARCASAIQALAWDYAMDRDALASALDAHGRWADMHARLRAAVDAPGRDLGSALLDVEDVADAYADEVLVPAHRLSGEHPDRERLRRRAFTLLAAGRGACRVLDASRRWHWADAARRAAVEALPRGNGFRRVDRWPAVLPDMRLGGLSLRVLVRSSELADEGRDGPDLDGVDGLSHCAGGYAGQCLSGQSRILSLRGSDGARLSTAELSFEGGRIRVAQHRGRGNSAPAAACRTALEAYLAKVASGPAPQPSALVVAGAVDPDDRARYDRHHPGNWEAVRDLWAPHVPRPLRTMGARELTALCKTLPDHACAWTQDSPFDDARPSPSP